MAEAGGGHMADEIKMIRQSDLMNRLVIDRDTMEEMGRVEVLWMYPPIHRVLGFVCKAGFLGKRKFAYRLAQIADLKDDNILVHSQPDATDAERVRLLESVLQYEVWSANGETPDATPHERIGKITDCLFKRKNGKIVHYLFTSNGLSGILGDVYQLPPARILSISENRVLVAESVVPMLHLDREGIVQKLNDVREFVREEAAFEWRSLTRRANRITAGTKERFQEITHQTQEFTQQTQERSQQFTQEAKSKVKILDEQLQEFPQDWVDRLRSKSRTVAEQVKQRAQNLSQQMEEGIGTVLEQTEDWFGEERSEEGEGRERGVRGEAEQEGEVPDAAVRDHIEQSDSERSAGLPDLPDGTVQNASLQDGAAPDDEWDDDEWDEDWGDIWGDVPQNEEKIRHEKTDRASVSPMSEQPPTSPTSFPSPVSPPAEERNEVEDDDEPWI